MTNDFRARTNTEQRFMMASNSKFNSAVMAKRQATNKNIIQQPQYANVWRKVAGRRVISYLSIAIASSWKPAAVREFRSSLSIRNFELI